MCVDMCMDGCTDMCIDMHQGCAEHPNQAEHTKMLDLMAPMVQKLTGWHAVQP